MPHLQTGSCFYVRGTFMKAKINENVLKICVSQVLLGHPFWNSYVVELYGDS